MKTLKKSLPIIIMILAELTIGILLIIDAVKLTEAVFRIFGVGLIIFSLVLVFRYLKDRREGTESVLTIASSIAAFVVGLVFAIGAAMIVEAGTTLCAIFYGAVMIVSGVLKISDYIGNKKEGFPVSGILLLAGILSIALGVLSIVLSSQALHIIGVIVGVSMIAEAMLDIIAIVMARRSDRRHSIYDTSGDDRDFDLD